MILRKIDFKKNRKGHVDWREFLCATPAQDYIFQKEEYEKQIQDAVKLIKDADAVIIGAGAGASTAAGLAYGGKRFTDNFAEFIEKYGGHYMTDMYAAGFYPFPSEEAKWGYWSKHALFNRFMPPALPLYKELYDIVKDKEYFVLTTNVDAQFYKAGFSADRIFATQGDYGKIQCQKGCHTKTYDAEELFRKMDAQRKDCLIPSELVPKCPVCGGNMAMHLRCDNYFVEDEQWHEAADRYADFLAQNQSKKVVLIELGVGFNTPIIIRFPFEKLVRENASYSLIRLNKEEAVVPESFGKRAIGIGGDMARAITDIKKLCASSLQEKREYLIQYLLKEENSLRMQKLPADKQEQERLLRSLMNVRLPKPVSEEFLKIQDEYLQERKLERGITDSAELEPAASDKRLYIWQGDITTLKCDAIVNACNSQMLGCFFPMHSCIDNFIHTYAGVELRLKMYEIMTKQGHEEETGRAKITSGYNLPAKYVLHTVGPIVQGRLQKSQEEQLASCYRSCLELAEKNEVKSIAFCCISTGVFMFPNERAAEIAIETVRKYYAETGSQMKVIFNVFKEEDLKIYRKLL